MLQIKIISTFVICCVSLYILDLRVKLIFCLPTIFINIWCHNQVFVDKSSAAARFKKISWKLLAGFEIYSTDFKNDVSYNYLKLLICFIVTPANYTVTRSNFSWSSYVCNTKVHFCHSSVSSIIRCITSWASFLWTLYG